MYCNQCGKENAENSRFCNFCGALIECGSEEEDIDIDDELDEYEDEEYDFEVDDDDEFDFDYNDDYEDDYEDDEEDEHEILVEIDDAQILSVNGWKKVSIAWGPKYVSVTFIMNDGDDDDDDGDGIESGYEFTQEYTGGSDRAYPVSFEDETVIIYICGHVIKLKYDDFFELWEEINAEFLYAEYMYEIGKIIEKCNTVLKKPKLLKEITDYIANSTSNVLMNSSYVEIIESFLYIKYVLVPAGANKLENSKFWVLNFFESNIEAITKAFTINFDNKTGRATYEIKDKIVIPEFLENEFDTFQSLIKSGIRLKKGEESDFVTYSLLKQFSRAKFLSNWENENPDIQNIFDKSSEIDEIADCILGFHKKRISEESDIYGITLSLMDRNIIEESISYPLAIEIVKEKIGNNNSTSNKKSSKRDNSKTIKAEKRNSSSIDNLDGIEFEELIKELLEKMGFDVETTKISGDGGIDLVAYNHDPITEGNKRWNGSIGEPALRDLYGAVTSERANKGILITNSNFTSAAMKFAEGKPIELIDGNKLDGMLKKYEINSFENKNKNSFSEDWDKEYYNIRNDEVKKNPDNLEARIMLISTLGIYTSVDYEMCAYECKKHLNYLLNLRVKHPGKSPEPAEFRDKKIEAYIEKKREYAQSEYQYSVQKMAHLLLADYLIMEGNFYDALLNYKIVLEWIFEIEKKEKLEFEGSSFKSTQIEAAQILVNIFQIYNIVGLDGLVNKLSEPYKIYFDTYKNDLCERINEGDNSYANYLKKRLKLIENLNVVNAFLFCDSSISGSVSLSENKEDTSVCISMDNLYYILKGNNGRLKGIIDAYNDKISWKNCTQAYLDETRRKMEILSPDVIKPPVIEEHARKTVIEPSVPQKKSENSSIGTMIVNWLTKKQ